MQPQEMRFNMPPLKQSVGLVCNECGCSTFNEVILLRKFSKFTIGSTQDALMPIPVFSCTKCGNLLEEGVDEEMKELIANTNKLRKELNVNL